MLFVSVMTWMLVMRCFSSLFYLMGGGFEASTVVLYCVDSVFESGFEQN